MSIITSSESAWKFIGRNGDYLYEFDMLILDEYESICNHFESNTFESGGGKKCFDSELITEKFSDLDTSVLDKDKKVFVNKTSFDYFKDFIKIIIKSKQIIILDADLSVIRLKWINDIIQYGYDTYE